MTLRSLCTYFFVFASLLLISCGGGSTVTAVSLSADPAQVGVSERSTITAKTEASVTEATLGEKITFSIRSNESGSELDIVNDRVDANGEAKAIYRAGPREGVDIIEASFESGARATVTIQVGSGVVLGSLTLERYGSAPNYVIRAVIRDTRGAPVSGVPVNFSTNRGTLGSSTVTSTNGIAETTLTLEAHEGATVYAHAGGQAASIRITSAGPSPDPARLSLSQSGNQVFAFVRDAGGNPVVGQVVNFRIDRGSVDPQESGTNANGIASTTFTLPEGVGQATVSATSGTLRASLAVTITPGPGPDPDPTVGSIQLTAFDNTRLRATVRDTQGNLMANTLVNFITDRGNASSASTNDNGIAESQVLGLDPRQTATVYAVSGNVRSNTVTVTEP